MQFVLSCSYFFLCILQLFLQRKAATVGFNGDRSSGKPLLQVPSTFHSCPRAGGLMGLATTVINTENHHQDHQHHHQDPRPPTKIMTSPRLLRGFRVHCSEFALRSAQIALCCPWFFLGVSQFSCSFPVLFLGLSEGRSTSEVLEKGHQGLHNSWFSIWCVVVFAD